MADTLSYDEWSQSCALPWPPRRFREKLARSLSDFILDEGGNFQSLGLDSAISWDTCKSFAACINRYVNDYMDGPPSCGTMFHRYQVQNPNDDPFPLGASHVINNSTIYPPQDGSIAGDPEEQIRQLHGEPCSYSEFNQSSLATARGRHLIQQMQSTDRVLGASDFGHLFQGELSSTGSGNRAASSRAASIDSHSESISRRRRREASPPGGNSSTTTPGSHRSKRADTRAVDKSKFPHECGICGNRFKFPARLK